jgi:CheY-like chemotaxis protein
VRVAITDTGSGMDGETQARLFEPFFTTKSVGKGTGLGLATVYGIVKQSEGFIWVYSEIDRGTTFKIYLPAGQEEAAQRPAPIQATTLGGTETILLVEDSETVRDLAQQVLRRYGYRVLAARDGHAALEQIRQTPEGIDLLLTDMVMPGMGGGELGRRAAEVVPGIRILYTSGYTDDAIVRIGALKAGLPYLQKPFTSRELARKVREVLDSEPDAGAGSTTPRTRT